MSKSIQVKFCTTFLTLSWDMHIQNITAMTFQDDIQNTVTKKSIFLNDDLNSFCTKIKVSLNDVKHSNYI